MKKITAYIMIMAILLTVCNIHTKSSQAAKKNIVGTEIKPLLSEKIDSSKQGVVISLKLQFSSEMTKGDDGSCYYFRNEGKGNNKKIVFYKNNGIKVCKTTMKKSIKDDFLIESFVKYEERFFVVLWSYEECHFILTTIDLETGKWGDTIETSDTYNSIIIYDNKFYCLENGSEITVYNLSGKKLRLEMCAHRKKVFMQMYNVLLMIKYIMYKKKVM